MVRFATSALVASSLRSDCVKVTLVQAAAVGFAYTPATSAPQHKRLLWLCSVHGFLFACHFLYFNLVTLSTSLILRLQILSPIFIVCQWLLVPLFSEWNSEILGSTDLRIP
jgi:hypothetical protein